MTVHGLGQSLYDVILSDRHYCLMFVVVVKPYFDLLFMEHMQCNLVQSHGVNVFRYVIEYAIFIAFLKREQRQLAG